MTMTTPIPNNVIRPPKGYEYTQGNQTKRLVFKDVSVNIQKRIEYLEAKVNGLIDEIRVLKKQQKYQPAINRRAKRVWMSDILVAVCDYFDTTPEDICSARRHSDIIKIRSCFINLCTELTHSSTPAIGRNCGNRDHTTVLHHINLKKNKINCWNTKTEPGLELWSDFGKLEAKLKSEAQPDNE